MKIFANNFALSFTFEPAHHHFRFERKSIAEIKPWLRAGRLLFPGQVAWLQAEETPNLLAELLALLQDAQVSQQYAQVTVSFRKSSAMSGFVDQLKSKFKPIAAAGGLVFGPEEDLLLIRRHGRWDLPKGKVERGEVLDEAAWREVAEETGLRNHVTQSEFARTFHVYLSRKQNWKLKTTYWYRMTSPSHARTTPQTEEGITEVRWMSLAGLRREIPETYPQIMDLLRAATAG
ncbi:MAG: NUDIX domain-containing protein [Bacteroidota bacterium]